MARTTVEDILIPSDKRHPPCRKVSPISGVFNLVEQAYAKWFASDNKETMSRVFWFTGPCLALLLAGIEWFSPTWPVMRANVAVRSALGAENCSDEGSPQQDSEVQALPLCIAMAHWSAGQLGKTILYRVLREGERMTVGYFVYWSTERPWGNTHLSHALVPALLTDAIYSHFLFVFPGLQRFLYGAGDIEGVRVTYERRSTGWQAASAVADDDLHHEVALDAKDFLDEAGRVIVMSDVWSHQLGAHHAAQAAHQGVPVSCFAGETLRPLTTEVARAFRLGSFETPRRACPAWKLRP